MVGLCLRVTAGGVVSLVLLGATDAGAQPLGVFRWQLQPFCNVVSLTVVREASSFLLSGSDDRCGAAQAAPATGTATANPDGTVSLGLVIVTPTGAPAHVSAVVNLSNVSGTWRDADGHTGPFVFNGSASDGSPLPPPAIPAVITSTQLAASLFAGTGTATTVARSDHLHDDRYYTQAQTESRIAARVAGAGGAITGPGINLPTPLTPQATFSAITEHVTTSMPGQLLVTKFAHAGIDCFAGARWYYLTVDGAPLRSSVSYRLSTAPDFLGTLIGVTDGALPAGMHTIAVAAQCAIPANFTNTGFHTVVSSSSVTVIP